MFRFLNRNVVISLTLLFEICQSLPTRPGPHQILVNNIRSQQLIWFKQDGGRYDADDIDFVLRSDRLIDMALAAKNDSEDATHLLDGILRWRKLNGVRQVNVGDFPKEVFSSGEFALVGSDRRNNSVLWIRVKNGVVPRGQDSLRKRQMIYYYEVMLHRGNGCFVAVADFDGVDWNHFDTEKYRYFLDTVRRHYPHLMQLFAVFNVPQTMTSVVAMLKQFAADEADKVRVVSKETLFEMIDKSQIPAYLGGNNTLDFSRAV